jgi:hypothetical protein
MTLRKMKFSAATIITTKFSIKVLILIILYIATAFCLTTMNMAVSIITLNLITLVIKMLSL